jgi:hypothetical protein
MGRRCRLLVVLACACALTLSGCVVIRSQDASQLDTIGKVRLSTTLCASQQGMSGTPAECQNRGNANQNASNDSASTESQLLIAYRVPAGTSGPSTFTNTATAPDGTTASLTFSRSASYEDELDEVLPPGQGFEWIGYLSRPFKYSSSAGDWEDQTVAQQVTVQPEFTLPAGPDGAPFKGPFAYRVIVGWRRSDTTQGASPGRTSSRPVDCTADPTMGGSDTQCADAPAKATIPTNLELATRDAGIVGGPPITASHGTTARVPFSFRFAGALPAQSPLTFSLRASTTVPGATATASRSSVTVTGDSSTDVDVTVGVGDRVAPGDYAVTLTATLPNGQQRTQQRVVTVPGPPESTVPPGINGDPFAGSLLTASPGGWRSFAPPALAYRWLRCDARGGNCRGIDGADGPALRVDDAHAGRRLRLTVVASTADGVTSATSEPTERVLDRRRPTLKMTLRKTRFTRRQFLRGVPVRVTPSEPVRMTFELLARTRKARIARVRNLVLARRSVPGTNLPTALLVRPRKALVRGNKRFSVTVAVTARDPSRNARTVRRLVRVRR